MSENVSYPDFSTDTIDDRLDVVIRILDAADALSTAVRFPSLKPSVYGYSKGKKYARVFYDMCNGQRVVAFFVQLDNGDVWKADGWKGPALNSVRGNINSFEGRKAIADKISNERLYFYPGF